MAPSCAGLVQLTTAAVSSGLEHGIVGIGILPGYLVPRSSWLDLPRHLLFPPILDLPFRPPLNGSLGGPQVPQPYHNR